MYKRQLPYYTCIHIIFKRRQRHCLPPEKGFEADMGITTKIALILVIIGALNWGLIGIFSFDLVAYLFGGMAAIASRVIYTLVGIAGIWCIAVSYTHLTTAPYWRRQL